MSTNSEAPERTALRKKIERLRSNRDSLLSQQRNTQGVFSGQQLAGGLAPAPSRIASAEKALEAAEAELIEYDASHPRNG